MEDIKEFREYAQLLLATRIFGEYLEIRAVLAATRRMMAENDIELPNFPTKDVEPEYFVDSWIKENVVGGTEEWREGVFKFFMKILVNRPRAKGKGE